MNATSDEQQMVTFTTKHLVPGCNLQHLLGKISDLNKKATKLGAQRIVVHEQFHHADHKCQRITHGVPLHKWVPDDEMDSAWSEGWTDTGIVRSWFTVTVTGETPKFSGGWTLAGVLTPINSGGTWENLIKAVPGEQEVPPEYRSRVGQCDHCRALRTRTETFVLKNDAGKYVMVGRQCLRDFLGHVSPHQLASMAELLHLLHVTCSEAGDEGSWGSGEEKLWSLQHFLEVTTAVIRHDGWMSRSKSRELSTDYAPGPEPTADRVLGFLCPPQPAYRSREYDKWSAEIKEIMGGMVVDHIITWARDGIVPDENGDYLYNLNLIARAGYVSHETAGIAASMIIAYRKAHDLDFTSGEARAPLRPSEWIGAVGSRIVLDVECIRVRETEGYYGATGVHSMRDGDGNELVWFASSKTEWMESGDKCHVKATIKSHGEYKGKKQTVLTRVSIINKEQGDAR